MTVHAFCHQCCLHLTPTPQRSSLFFPHCRYNKREADFPGLREYNDYLEQVEDIGTAAAAEEQVECFMGIRHLTVKINSLGLKFDMLLPKIGVISLPRTLKAALLKVLGLGCHPLGKCSHYISFLPALIVWMSCHLRSLENILHYVFNNNPAKKIHFLMRPCFVVIIWRVLSSKLQLI